MTPGTMDVVAAALFGLAVLHTFAASLFERLAHARPRHAGLWHLLGEVEVVFGFWALVLVLAMAAMQGLAPTIAYLESRNFTEPMFVFAIMVIAATRPILWLAGAAVRQASSALPMARGRAEYLVVLWLVPLLGSFITEPAAMTLAALLLRDRFFDERFSWRTKYATLGTLFVNVSIGGTLTPFAAPPVLMVAGAWGWDLRFMLLAFGWKAALLVTLNAALATALAWRELGTLPDESPRAGAVAAVPWPLVLVHVAFLAGTVVFAHHPVVFVGLLLFFLGVATAYERHQDRLMLREGLLVAFFLAGLVVLGGLQRWWLEPLLLGMSAGVPRRHRPHRVHRQRRPHLPGCAGAGPVRQLQVDAGRGRGHRRRSHRHRQCPQSGRLGAAARSVSRRSGASAGTAGRGGRAHAGGRGRLPVAVSARRTGAAGDSRRV